MIYVLSKTVSWGMGIPHVHQPLKPAFPGETRTARHAAEILQDQFETPQKLSRRSEAFCDGHLCLLDVQQARGSGPT